MPRKLVVEIIGDSSSLEKAYKRSGDAGRKFSSDLSHAGRGIAVAQVGFRGLGRSLAFASGGFLAGAAISTGIKNVISDASDLNEEINKSNVVFGKSASSIQAWSKTTADASGIARAAALEAAGGFGSILETSGLNEKAAAGMSKSLVNLAGDIASFNNIDPNEALEKLRSGLVGEAEPLRTVGVLLSESRVKQEAYRLGLAKVGATLTDAQKVQARYSIILKDTARQQGDFGRTSNGLANATRRVKAGITDIAASIGSTILPSLASATSGFADFLGEIGKARGIKAKINVAIETGERLGGQAFQFGKQIEEQVTRILETTDFGAITARLFAKISDAASRIDWRAVGRSVGQRLIDVVNALAAIIQAIDWSVVGRGIVNGIIRFLKGVDWIAVIKAIARLMLAALKASRDLIQGIGDALAKAIGDGIKAGLRALGAVLEREALKLVLHILKPLDFTILGKHVIPGLDRLISSIETKLDALATSAETSAGRVAAAVDGIRDRGVTGTSGATVQPTPTPTPRTTTPDVVPDPTPKIKDTTTKLERAQKAFAKLIDALNLKFEQAQATRTLKDDIARQEDINDAIRKEIGVEGKTTDLARQLFEGRQKLADLQKQQTTQAQFRALGLTAEGDVKPPSVGTLRRRLDSLRTAIEGTVLDTAKTRSELRRIASVLSGAFGKVGADVRASIKSMLDDISSALSGGSSASSAPLTKFAKHGVEGLVKGLGLTTAQVKELRQRFAQFNRFDLAPATAGGGGRTGRQQRFPRAGDPVRDRIDVFVYLDGQQVEATVTRRQQKKRGRNTPQRRGVRPGR